jgi:hypothetical protein
MPETEQVIKVSDDVIVKTPPLSLVMGTFVVPENAAKSKVKPLPPMTALPVVGVTVMEVTPVRITVAVAVAGRASALALIPALPGDTPVRTPVFWSIVATFVVSLFQVTPLVTTLRVPSS